MARTTPPRRVTRLDREAASKAARDARPYDLRPALRVGAVVLGIVFLIVAASNLAPEPTRLGGPLQEVNLAGGARFETIRKTTGRTVTFALYLPWNTASSSAVIDGLEPLEADGVEIDKAGVVPLGVDAIETGTTFPPPGLSLGRVRGASIPPGTGPLDGVQLAIGLRGEGSVLGFVVDYHVGDRSYRAVFTQGAMLCVKECDGQGPLIDRQRELGAELLDLVAAPAR